MAGPCLALDQIPLLEVLAQGLENVRRRNASNNEHLRLQRLLALSENPDDLVFHFVKIPISPQDGIQGRPDGDVVEVHRGSAFDGVLRHDVEIRSAGQKAHQVCQLHIPEIESNPDRGQTLQAVGLSVRKPNGLYGFPPWAGLLSLSGCQGVVVGPAIFI